MFSQLCWFFSAHGERMEHGDGEFAVGGLGEADASLEAYCTRYPEAAIQYNEAYLAFKREVGRVHSNQEAVKAQLDTYRLDVAQKRADSLSAVSDGPTFLS